VSRFRAVALGPVTVKNDLELPHCGGVAIRRRFRRHLQLLDNGQARRVVLFVCELPDQVPAEVIRDGAAAKPGEPHEAEKVAFREEVCAKLTHRAQAQCQIPVQFRVNRTGAEPRECISAEIPSQLV
jgi:hypothetical protein